MRFIDEQQPVFRQIIQQRDRRRSCVSVAEVAGIILHPRAIADLAHHFHVMRDPLVQPDCLDQAIIPVQLGNPLFHISEYLFGCRIYFVRGRREKRFWRNQIMVYLSQRLAGNRVHPLDRRNSVIQQFHPNRPVLGISGENVNHITLDAERCTLESALRAIILQQSQATN